MYNKEKSLNAAFVVIGKLVTAICKYKLVVYTTRILRLIANNIVIWQPLAVIYTDTLKVYAGKRHHFMQSLQCIEHHGSFFTDPHYKNAQQREISQICLLILTAHKSVSLRPMNEVLNEENFIHMQAS